MKLDVAAWPDTPGIHDVELEADGGRRARFTLSLPEQAPPGPRPCVLVLHYAGEPTPWYGRPLLETLVEPGLRALAPILVAPETLGGPWHLEENEAWVLALVDAVAAHYGADPHRHVAAGYSMGAMGVWHLLTHYPARFSAGVPISGFPNRDLDCAIPVRALHAPSDELFDYERLAALVEAAQSRGSPLSLLRVDATGHFDLQGFAAAIAALPAWLTGVWDDDAP